MTSARDHMFATAVFAAFAASMAVAADAASPDLNSQEFPAETAALVDATVALFEQIEARVSPERSPSDVPVIQAPVLATPASVDAAAEKATVLTGQGPVKNLTGYRITWYPVDRFLGSVDFMGTWDGNRNLVCGYVTWDLSDPDTPVLEQISATYLETAELASSDPDQAHAALLDANCAFGAIDANFEIFD